MPFGKYAAMYKSEAVDVNIHRCGMDIGLNDPRNCPVFVADPKEC